MAWRFDEARMQAQIAAHRAERDRISLIEMDAMPRSAGLCYFFGAPDVLIKIGYSRNVSQRIANLSSNTGPYKMSLMATARGGQDREAYYHHRFKAHRSSGEWFEPHPDILAEIARLNEQCDIAENRPAEMRGSRLPWENILKARP